MCGQVPFSDLVTWIYCWSHREKRGECPLAGSLGPGEGCSHYLICADWKPEPQAAAWEVCNQTPPEKAWEMGVSPVSSELSPGRTPTASAHMPGKPLHCLLWSCETRNASPVGIQSQVFWWPIPQVGALIKRWGNKCAFQSICSSGRSWELGGPHDHMVLCQEWGLLGEYVPVGLSYSFRCGHFLSHLMCRSHSAGFWIALRGDCCICRYTCWCPGRREFQEPPMSPFGPASSNLVVLNHNHL